LLEEGTVLREFREFAMRGNVLDMAIGVIMGAAFGRIVTSLVNDLIMPPIGLLTSGVDFSNLFVSLGPASYATLEEATRAGAPLLRYGVFIKAVLDFLIVAFVIFLVVRQGNRWKKQEVAAPAPPPAQETLLREIRDLLARR
jgi:large conductance mechanosensitive channel